MCVGEQAQKSYKYDFSKIYIQNYKNQKFLGRVRWVRWVRQLVEAQKPYRMMPRQGNFIIILIIFS